MKQDIIKDFNLPPYVKGKSFAEASKAIENKFAERNDVAANETKQELMQRLAQAQEHIKMQESLKANASQVPDMMGGDVPEGFEEFAPQQMAYGGFTGPGDGDEELDKTEVNDINDSTGIGFQEDTANSLFARTGKAERVNPQVDFGKYGDAGYFTQGNTLGNNRVAIHNTDKNPHNANTMKQTMDYLRQRNPGIELEMEYKQRGQNQMAEGGFQPNAIGGAMGGLGDMFSLGAQNLGDTGVDTSGASMQQQQKQNVGLGAAGSAMKGASAGAAIGSVVPGIGTAIGAGAGALFGGVSGLIGGKKANKDIDKANRNASVASNAASRSDFALGGPIDTSWLKPTNKLAPSPDTEIKGGDVNIRKKADINKLPKHDPLGTALYDTKKFIGDNIGGAARLAPAIAGAVGLANLKRSPKESLDRLDSRYKPDYVDERALQNTVQDEATNTTRALANASNGSAGTLRSNLLGSQLQKTKALSDAYLKADGMNRQENARAQQFNSQNDRVNLRQSNIEKDNEARDEGAYQSNKSAMRAALFEDIGAIGKEAVDKKNIAKMFGYDVKGNYVVGKNGEKKTWREFQRELKQYRDNGGK